MKRVYLSLPITGYDYEERRRLSLQVQKELEKKGYETFNPMFNGLPKDAKLIDHMRADIKKLCDCHEIILFPKWSKSMGCTQEFNVAIAIGCEVKFLLSTEPLVIVDTKIE